MTDLNELDLALGAILSNLSPASRKRVLRELSEGLRNRQKKRITAQKNPDGSAYAPRRAHPERGKMFKRLKLARNLKFRATDNEGIVEFRGPHIRTEQIHQYGLEGRISPQNHRMIKYPARRLLGFSREDEAWVRETLLEWLAKS